jgi:ATP-dependent helicase/nuclease subunit B
MPDVFAALEEISRRRRDDPLAPVTVVAPSHAAALQLRRRLAGHGPFAGVRFEPLPRVAELLGAGRLAASGRVPLARPIGDYASEMVARESQGRLADVGDLPGYARVLRRIFRRLRRGGIRSSSDVHVRAGGHLAEILRLYDRFREITSPFYDDEDLLDAAAEAVRRDRPGFLPDLGLVHYVPPLPESAGGAALLAALKEMTQVAELAEPDANPSETFLVAPDPASEAQEAVRMAIKAMQSGVPLHEIAVLHGAGDGYGPLLREAFAAADVTSVPLPGVPVAETPAGRGVLALAVLPELEYARKAVVDFLSVAPIREWLPAGKDAEGNDRVEHEMTSLWDKLSREALITRGLGKWRTQLNSFAREREEQAATMDETEYEQRIEIMRREAGHARRLLTVIEALAARIEPLTVMQPAERFIESFQRIVREYIDPSALGREEALEEIEQLGTVGALGGEFSLGTFAESLRANLEARAIRPQSIGRGVIIADYRTAAGMRFERVILCGAFEGAVPAGPGTDAILPDSTWRALRAEHPFIEDAAARIERAQNAVQRAVVSAGNGSLTWSAPRYESGGTREYYPAPAMVKAYSALVGSEVTASKLRGEERHESLTRPPSPLAVALQGPALTSGEAELRRAVALVRENRPLPADHARYRALESLKARRSDEFSEWEGNLAALNDPGWTELRGTVSPTSLENYATCGWRYFARSLLRLEVVKEPEEQQMMDAAERGTLIHRILERFFLEQRDRGRPQPNEAWTTGDLERLLAIAGEELDAAASRGLTGLDIFAEHEARTIRADLAQFLEKDTLFRQETGAVPVEFEVQIPETTIAGVKLRGRVDRIDRDEEGRAWVIDYKTGSKYGLDTFDKDPLLNGTKLQLPVYLAATGGDDARALYWFISRKADFERVVYVPNGERDQRFQDTLVAIVEGIRAGAFPAVPGDDDEWRNRFENCGYCDFDRICSRRREIEFAAKEDHDAMAPWRRVRRTASPGNDP